MQIKKKPLGTFLLNLFESTVLMEPLRSARKEKMRIKHYKRIKKKKTETWL